MTPLEENPDAMMHGKNIGPGYAKPVEWDSFPPNPPSTSRIGPLPRREQNPTTAPITARPGNLQLNIYPAGCLSSDSTIAKEWGAAWVAVMWLHTEDLARLMRDGFDWDESNVIKEAGFLTREYKKKMPWWGPKPSYFSGDPEEFLCRHFSLRSSEDDPSWTASLTVWFPTTITDPTPEAVIRFRLADLHPENITSAVATDDNGRTVYWFSWFRPNCRFINCIYDDMPLRGWWPCPKARPEEEEGLNETLGEVKSEEERARETLGEVKSETKYDEEGANDTAGRNDSNHDLPWQIITENDM
ncbi:hypothetical protein SODALDRAFT_335007 [Sodiomyces alkalinus F11]|uniref:Uncharacterized protein n=1 Tax=Sodiomyces alkalinus (strain CBS 110278 / VKM F-3762 / F11) TaxID=1314773 RepID=A0A3N2PQL8_SODAK|nr:hypothetical protein SODALDRAFT_335007 [Sodiomyces alkalinus F11]ROT36807.1 hypothetical protein SODALDRAFT_335007 [Sodiomyces alkalinus F11]